MDRLVRDYLHQKETDRGWDHVAIQHMKVLRSLYALRAREADEGPCQDQSSSAASRKASKLPPPKGSVFEAVAGLKKMSPVEAAGAI